MKKQAQMKLMLFFALLAMSIQAQDTLLKTRDRRVATEVFVLPGAFLERVENGNLGDFKKLAPQSDILNRDLSSYQVSEGYSRYSQNFLAVLAGLKFGGKEKTRNQVLRVGFSLNSGFNLFTTLFRKDIMRMDTVALQPGKEDFIDSVVNRWVSMKYMYQQVRIDVSYLFRTDIDARWSLYTGAGISAGMSVNSRTEIHYSSECSLRPSTWEFSSMYQSSSYTSRSERFHNRTNTGIFAYIPLGTDFRIGKKREFWKRAHIFAEVRPGVNTTVIPEYGSLSNHCMYYGVGFRVAG
jgi:hypothetical protein